jgi:hypothetical protein
VANGGDGRNPARERPGLAGKDATGDVGSPRVPFRALEGPEEVLAVVHGGVVVVRPQEFRLRRTGCRERRAEGPGRCGGVLARLWFPSTARRWFESGSSPWSLGGQQMRSGGCLCVCARENSRSSPFISGLGNAKGARQHGDVQGRVQRRARPVWRRHEWVGGGMVGATPPVRAWRVAQGERVGKAVRHGWSHSARSSGR